MWKAVDLYCSYRDMFSHKLRFVVVFVFAVWILFAKVVLPAGAQESSMPIAANRVLTNQMFHVRASEPMGLLIPLYIYPANIHTNKDFNRVIQLKRQYSEIPFWVVLNPASGPGDSVQENYTKAIDRLVGAGCVVLGYVPTNYGKRSVDETTSDMKVWREGYPRVHGIFFDEMIYEDTDKAVSHQIELNSVARGMGFWPTVGNPGAETPGRYFAADAADVIVIHEAAQWPTEAKLHGDYFGGYSDYPPFTRAVMVHSCDKCDASAIKMAKQYVRWIYLTQDTYKPNDPEHPNPWDQLSVHLDSMCRAIVE